MTRRYPPGAGWIAGYALGILTGVIAWSASGEVTIGLILFVATGTTLGFAFERSIDTRPLTPRERFWVLVLSVVGVLVGLFVFVYVVLFR